MGVRAKGCIKNLDTRLTELAHGSTHCEPDSIPDMSHMTHHATRESWLMAAVNLIRPIFLAKNHVIPEDVMVSCGFASTGTRSRHIGQCWSRGSCTNERNQIFISPVLFEPVEVLDTLVHELIHAVDDCKNKHGREFKKIALSLGLKGPMRSAGAGPELLKLLEQLSLQLGPYPHGALKVAHRKAVYTARARAKCPECGFQVPMYKRFLEYGPPLCPKHKIEMTPVGNWGEE